MKINEAKNLIKTLHRQAREENVYTAVEIVSGPGMGKSAIVEQAVQELSLEYGEPVGFKPFFLTTVEPPDVRGFGLPGKDADGKLTMNFTAPPWAVKKGEPASGILFLDELRQASHDVQKPSAELQLNRKVGDYSLPDGWIVVAASNRESDRSGVQRELAFITNRRMLIKIEPNLDAWVDWAERPAVIDPNAPAGMGKIMGGGVHPLAIAFAKVRPNIVFADAIPEKPGPFCTPRSLVMVSKLIGKLDMMTFTEAAMGLLGEGAAAEFVAFLRVAAELPTFEDIIANPEKADLPKKSDAQHAAMQMISHRIDEKTAPQAFKYLKRMGREFQVAGLKGTFRRIPSLVSTKEFAAWLRDNKELVMQANLLDKKFGGAAAS